MRKYRFHAHRLLLPGCVLLFVLGCDSSHLTQTPLDMSPIRIPTLKSRPDDDKLRQLAVQRKNFLELCEKMAEEVVPPRPLEVAHVYVFDATENVTAMWSFKYFEEIKTSSLGLYNTANDISVVNSLSTIVPKQGHYIWKRSMLEQVTQGDFTYRGVKQEIVDTVSGEVKATRTNYYLGSDLARGVSCLDSNWARGFDSFVVRTLGFRPPYPRTDQWVKTTPALFVRAQQMEMRPTDANEFMAPIRPSGSVYDYNSRTITIDGVAHYLRQTFNQEPLRMVGVHSFPKRQLISYETNGLAPSVLLQIRNKQTGQLLQEVYVKLPLSVFQPNEAIAQAPSWRIAADGLSFKDGKLLVDVVRLEPGDKSNAARYFRYRLEAPWNTENVEQESLPPHLNDGYWEKFTIPKNKIANSVREQQVIGRWVSSPVGTVWEFFEDGKLQSDYWEKRGQWSISSNQLSANIAGRDDPNKRTASFSMSKDGRTMEVTFRDRAGEYAPFLLTKLR